MSQSDLVKRAQRNVASFHRGTGVLCTIRGLTYNETTHLSGPPYVTKATHVPVSISSLASIHDPDIATVVRSLNISFQAYRLLTLPIGLVVAVKGDRISKEPFTSNSDTYIVVEAVAPDETTQLEIILHCQKLGV